MALGMALCSYATDPSFASLVPVADERVKPDTAIGAFADHYDSSTGELEIQTDGVYSVRFSCGFDEPGSQPATASFAATLRAGDLGDVVHDCICLDTGYFHPVTCSIVATLHAGDKVYVDVRNNTTGSLTLKSLYLYVEKIRE